MSRNSRLGNMQNRHEVADAHLLLVDQVENSKPGHSEKARNIIRSILAEVGDSFIFNSLDEARKPDSGASAATNRN